MASKRELQLRLQAINAGFLEGQSLITARFLAAMLQNELDHEVCRDDLWRVDPLGGFHLMFAALPGYQRIDSSSAASAYLVRLNRLGAVFQEHITNLRTGLAQGYRAPRVAVRRVIDQLEKMCAERPAETPYVNAAQRVSGLDAGALQSFQEDVERSVKTTVIPALQTYLKFLKTEVAPLSRTKISIAANPNGELCYKAALQEFGAGYAAPELHDIGMEELSRLRAQMGEIAASQGMDRTAFAAALKADAGQFLPTRDAVIDFNRRLLGTVQTALPKAFKAMPTAVLEVRAVEPFREQDAPAGFYEPAASDASHPAYYYVNAFNPQTRPLYNMEALAFHEGLPGHHLQIALAQEAAGLPMVCRQAGQTTFVEGWGLYAELLADELGLYSGPAARFGMLNFQALRAARLVVDTGIHALGWSRERAVQFMSDNLLLPDSEIANEVDRYVVWPGQALAYMSGRMELQKLRREAQVKKAERFDLRDFHAQVLAHGAVPLPVLRGLIGAWLSR